MNKELRVNRVNIYINHEDKKKLVDLKNKYHLSFSTIIDIIGQHYNTIPKEKINLVDKPIYNKDGSFKTSVKPKYYGIEMRKKAWTMNLSTFLTNTTKLFLRNGLRDFSSLTNQEISKLHAQIHNSMRDTWDENWDGNDFCKKLPRFIKQNPKYTKKLLGLESDD